jgi:hypothetical protein
MTQGKKTRNLTDVLIDDTHHSEFVALNKMQIESVVQID